MPYFSFNNNIWNINKPTYTKTKGKHSFVFGLALKVLNLKLRKKSFCASFSWCTLDYPLLAEMSKTGLTFSAGMLMHQFLWCLDKLVFRTFPKSCSILNGLFILTRIWMLCLQLYHFTFYNYTYKFYIIQIPDIRSLQFKGYYQPEWKPLFWCKPKNLFFC